MVCLPQLILVSQIEGARMLQVRGQDDGLISRLARQLYAEIPGVEGDEDGLELLVGNPLLVELREPVNGLAKGSSVADVLPGQGGQAR